MNLSSGVFWSRNWPASSCLLCLFVVLSSWKTVKRVSQSCFGQFCLNYWFVEEATTGHCGLCQSQTIVYHYSALFFRQASFLAKGRLHFCSPRGRRVLVRRGQSVDRFCLIHSTFILKKSAFCWLVYLHTQVWPKHFATEGTVERLFNFWWLRDGGFLARLSWLKYLTARERFIDAVSNLTDSQWCFIPHLYETFDNVLKL